MRFAVCLLLLVSGFAAAIPIQSNATSAWSFNLKLAETARDFSRVSYCQDADIAKWSCVLCEDDFVVKTVIKETENPNQIQGFVGHSVSKKLVVVSFRGSSNEANWIANLKFNKIDSDFSDKGCDNCKIHRGFYECYGNISQQVTSAVNELAAQFPSFDILATGHSQGGALAVHAAVDLAVNEGHAHKVTMVTFGEPRLGNENFAKFCSQAVPTSTRIVHKNDLVPHMPPNEGVLSFDFHHEAREVWNIDDELKVQICDGSGEDDKCSKSVPLRQWSIFDHLFYLGHPTGCSKTLEISEQKRQQLFEAQEQIIQSLQHQKIE